MRESTPTELLSMLDGQLRTERGIDLALGDATHRLTGMSPSSSLQEARQLLLRRVSDLQSSVADLSGVIQKLRELQRVLRFTEAGWPERQRELSEACSADALHGLGAWLDDWFTALSTMRLDACQRLLSMDKALPAGSEVLLRRCRATALALGRATQGEDWFSVAAPLIRAGVRGLRLREEIVPTPETRHQLCVLLVRLSLALDRPEDAQQALEEAPGPADAPILQALRERLRLYGEPSSPDTTMINSASPADALFEAARVLIGPGNAAVADLQIDAGMSAARRAVAAPATLEEASRQIVLMLAPVPAQIHLALGERAMADGDDAVAHTALERALEVGTGGALVAEAHERLAELARRDGNDEVSISHRLQAADTWASASQFDRILSNAEQVLDLRPEHSEARCWKAGSLMQLFWSSSASSPSSTEDAGSQHEDSRRQLHKAHALAHSVATHEREDVGNSVRAWALYLEGCLWNRLAEFEGEPSRRHQWAALAAALESLTLQPHVETYWLRLTDAASELELWSLAELAARRAAESLSPEAVEQHIRTLINLGEHDQALELLGDPLSPRQWNMRAHLLLHRGDLEAAIAVFAEHPPMPDEGWARISHLNALLVAGHQAEGLSAARDLDAWLRPRLKEFSNWEEAAWVAMLLGDDGRVEDMVRMQRSNGLNTSDQCLAVVRASQQLRDESSALFASYVRTLTSLDYVLQWDRVDLKIIKDTLANRNVPMPDLSGASMVLEEVHAELVDRRDPLVELRLTVEKAPPNLDLADTRLAPVIIAVARHDLGGAEEGLHELGSKHDGESFFPLRTWLEEQMTLADVEPVSADSDETAGASPENGALRPEAVQFSVYLPPSWFDDEQPPEDHPLVVRHLREMRLLPPGDSVPPVRVSSSAELEPNGYVIAVEGRPIETGRLPLGRRLLPSAALSLIPRENDVHPLEEQALAGQRGEVTIPDTVDVEFTVGGLLSRSAAEVLVNRIEQLPQPDTVH